MKTLAILVLNQSRYFYLQLPINGKISVLKSVANLICPCCFHDQLPVTTDLTYDKSEMIFQQQ